MRMLLRNVETELVATDLVSVAEGALTLLKRQIREHQVQLLCQGLHQTELIVMGDATQLQIAISNLLRNAIAAVMALPIPLRHVQVSLHREGDRAVLAVADSGPGLEFDSDADTLYQTT